MGIIKKLLLGFCVCFTMACFSACETNVTEQQPSNNPNAGVAILQDGEVFVYDENGERINQNETFVKIGDNVYYVINNIPFADGYKIIENRIYYFNTDGVRCNDSNDAHTFSADGYMTGTYVQITLDGKDYFLVNDYAYQATQVKGVVYESDSDYDIDNNPTLAGVSCTATVAGNEFTVTTNENGEFAFSGKLPAMQLDFTFVLDGYITATGKLIVKSDGSLQIVLDRNVSNALTGRIVLADKDLNPTNNPPLADAKISLNRTSSTNKWYYETTSDNDGYYRFETLTAGMYTLTVEKDGYKTATQIVQARYNETTIQNVTLEIIPESNETQSSQTKGTASGVIKDARTGDVVSVGLTVYIREGINNILGTPLCTLTTNQNGEFVTPELPAGNYTAYVVDERTQLPNDNEDERYGAQTINLKILAGENITEQGASISNNVGISGAGVRIVLEWGATPNDLDSHLLIDDYHHVYYGNKEWSNCSLDVDDTTAYGPETITIEAVQNHKYEYYVYNYSNSGTFQEANATVKVYFGNQLAYTFNAPQGVGYYWHILTIDENGDITIHNAVANVEM